MQKFYAVIIGSEILQGRRVDKHFEFVKNELAKRDLELSGSFVVKDDKDLLREVFLLIKNQKNAYMFCFGGIGATPDDLTREISSEVFTSKPLTQNKQALKLIEDEFKKDAYPYRVKMANLPTNAKLLKNVINNVPGYSLEDRLFFMPGFPQMSHPMFLQALDLYVKRNEKRLFISKFRVFTKENDLVGFMEELPKDIELSSLPHHDTSFSVEIMLRCYDRTLLEKWSETLELLLQSKNINYKNLKDKHEY